jgi:enoyl-CoA hydratase/carnithine racemase
LSLAPDDRTAHTEAVNVVADAIEAFPTPVVAAVAGPALAGGAELALACDIRVASERAAFGFPEVALGIFPGAGAPVRLPRLLGAAVARDLLFTGRRVEANEAARLGLVHEVVAPEHLERSALDRAELIARQAPLAIRALKRALLASEGLPAAEAHRVVAQQRRALDATADYAEGLAAFAERRPPRFRGD